MKKFIRKIIMRVKFYKIYYINIFNSVLNNDIKFNELFYLSSKTLRYRYSNDLNPFLQYIQVLNMLQQDRGIKKGLEIGGGYSTILLTKLVFDNNCQITSIDINPNKYKDILPSKKHRVRLFESVEIVEDLTISYNTMLDFYKNTLKEYISEYNIKELQDSILGFVNDYDGGYISLNKEDPISYLFQDEKLNLFNKLDNEKNIILLKPVSYHQMLKLNMGAKVMLTDSGGLQEECSVLGTPCLTLRENTERPITLRENGGTSVLVGNDVTSIIAEFNKILLGDMDSKVSRPKFWDGQTAQRCLDAIINYN